MTTKNSPRPGPPAPAPRPPAGGDEPLLPLANQIRLAYVYAYRNHWLTKHGAPTSFGDKRVPRWDGGEAADGKMYKPIWFRIARAVVDRGIAVDDLVKAVFRGWDRKDPPWPSNMLSAAALAWAAENHGAAAEDAARALRLQKELWKTQIFLTRRRYDKDFATAARETLRNRRLELSSIFRYCMAVEGDDHEVAREFEEGALVQYVSSRRAYDGGWGDVVPPRLKALADRLLTA